MHTHNVSHMHDGVEEDDNSVLKTKLWEKLFNHTYITSEWITGIVDFLTYKLLMHERYCVSCNQNNKTFKSIYLNLNLYIIYSI